MAELAQELVYEILLWLPVKSLLRFRSVSKSLCAVIDSADFINSHLSRSSQNFHLRKLIFRDVTTKMFNVCDVNFEKAILHLENPVSSSSSSKKNVCGYCKGLILLCQNSIHDNVFRLALWNPSTRKYRDLPRCPAVTSQSFGTIGILGTGLGYDDSTDDYKVFLKVLCRKQIEIEIGIWIYGLKSNVWRRYQNFHSSGSLIDKDRPVYLGNGVFADGSLNWLCTISNKTEIVAFDMRTETFSLMSQPRPVCSIESIDAKLTKMHVLEGCLCIAYFFKPDFSTLFGPVRTDLHIRKEDAVDGFTWTQLYSIAENCWRNDIWLYRVKVLGYSKRGDKILLDRPGKVMLSYDLKRKSCGKVDIHKDFDCVVGSLSSCFCQESLVSVGGRV